MSKIVQEKSHKKKSKPMQKVEHENSPAKVTGVDSADVDNVESPYVKEEDVVTCISQENEIMRKENVSESNQKQQRKQKDQVRKTSKKKSHGGVSKAVKKQHGNASSISKFLVPLKKHKSKMISDVVAFKDSKKNNPSSESLTESKGNKTMNSDKKHEKLVHRRIEKVEDSDKKRKPKSKTNNLKVYSNKKIASEKKIRDGLYMQHTRETMEIKYTREITQDRIGTNRLFSEEPILEESENEGSVFSYNNFEESLQPRPVENVFISPRIQDNEFISPGDEDKRSQYTDVYSPDFQSRLDEFSEDEIEETKPKKKKKTKKQKREERKQRAKRRRARKIRNKILGLYETESLTINIKRKRKLRLESHIPDRKEKKRKKSHHKKLIVKLKKIQQTLEAFKKKQQDIQENLRKLETKKDKDAKPIMETLYEQLQETEQLYQEALKELNDVQQDIGKKLGKKEESKQQEKSSPGPAQGSRKPAMSPDDQELTYELKAQLMKNIEMQNHKLKTELTLHEKVTESRLLNQQNRKLHEDSALSRTNTLRLMKMFEKKAKEADERLKEMQRELHKSQQLTKKYQQLLELERRKMGGGSGHVTPISTGDDGESPRVPPPSSYSLLGGNVRVNDVIRKNEVLVEENGNLRREIQRLKQDNATLIKKTKHAMSDKDEIIHRLETSNQRNRTLSRDLSREKSQHNMLARSLTRQASDWIMLKKQLAQFDEEYKWSQVKTQKEEADQRFGRLPPIYTACPMTPITEVSTDLSTPVSTPLSDTDVDMSDQDDQSVLNQSPTIASAVSVTPTLSMKANVNKMPMSSQILESDSFTNITILQTIENRRVGPVNPSGAEERTYQHSVTRNVYMPRKMYPVEQYGNANQSEA